MTFSSIPASVPAPETGARQVPVGAAEINCVVGQVADEQVMADEGNWFWGIRISRTRWLGCRRGKPATRCG